MATTQKKSTTTAKKPAASGGRSSSAASKSTAKKEPAKRPMRREIGAGVCLLLALCTGVSFFQSDGVVLRILPVFLKGMTGFGCYFMAPALIAAAFSLLFHHGRPVAFRTTCALLIPVQMGVIHHLLACKLVFEGSLGIFPLLWKSGQEMASGGVLSGMIAQGVSSVLGKVATTVLSFAVLIALLTVVFYKILLIFYRRWKEREPYQEEELPQQPAPKAAAKVAPRPQKPRIDIPLDDEAEPAEKSPGILTGFFRQKSKDQRTPDQLLLSDREDERTSSFVEEAPSKIEIPARRDGPFRRESPIRPAAVPAPMPAPLPDPEPIAAEEETKAAPAAEEKPAPQRRSTAKSRAEVAQAAEEVSAEIESRAEKVENTYRYPPLELLEENGSGNHMEAGAELRANARRLADTLISFGVEAQAGDVIRGPSITRYEFVLDQGVKLSKITNLADDIALALGASGVRIAPVPGKISVVGIEVPNKAVTPVLIREVLESREFTGHKSQVAFAVGRDIGNADIVGDIGKLPHLLIAGTTGSGKSVCTNALIISLLYKSSPDEVKFIMVDPKMVELGIYNGIPHLLIPVVTDPKKAAGALQWAVFEMMKRYKTFSELGVKKLEEYNALAKVREDLKPMPAVVVVIDELADLMLVAAKEVEESICRVAQMGRASGIHLIIATQRPSADVITGLMKANIPSRIAFAVASSLESRIILDNTGAEKLVGRGDMLFAPLGNGKPQRVQGCFISPEEIERVVSFVKESGEAQYSDEVMKKIEEAMAAREKGSKNGGGAAPAESSGGGDDDADELLSAAVDVVLETGMASVSMLQRRLKLGYSRAARLVDQMEERGIVGPFEGSKPRQVLISKERWQESQMAADLKANAPMSENDPILSGEPIDPNDPPWLE